jgi:general secretion pathway protein J
MRMKPHTGFTLLELLVAMAIFGIVSVLAMGGLNAVLSQQVVARKQLDRLHQVQRAVRVLTNDFSQVHPRFVRDELGDPELPLLAPCGVENLVCFSRDGWSNPFFQLPRGTLQRVQYRLENQQLIREYWAVMDRTLGNDPRKEVLLDGVDSVEIRFTDPSGSGEWVPEWPPAQVTAPRGPGLPAGARIALTLTDWGEIVRVIEVLK